MYVSVYECMCVCVCVCVCMCVLEREREGKGERVVGISRVGEKISSC